jgi:hypothetical protein
LTFKQPSFPLPPSQIEAESSESINGENSVTHTNVPTGGVKMPGMANGLSSSDLDAKLALELNHSSHFQIKLTFISCFP